MERKTQVRTWVIPAIRIVLAFLLLVSGVQALRSGWYPIALFMFLGALLFVFMTMSLKDRLMNAERSDRLLIRITGGILLVIFAMSMLSGDRYVMAWSMFVLIAAAFCIGPDIGDLLTGGVGRFYLGGDSKGQSDYPLAKLAKVNGDWNGAIQAYVKYAEENVSDQRVRFEIANLYNMQLKDKRAAYSWYGKVVEYKRGTEMEALAFMEMALFLCEQGRVEGVRSLYLEMILRFPTHPSTAAVHEAITKLQEGKTQGGI